MNRFNFDFELDLQRYSDSVRSHNYSVEFFPVFQSSVSGNFDFEENQLYFDFGYDFFC